MQRLVEFTPKAFQYAMNITLFCIGIVLTVAILNSAFYIVTLIPELLLSELAYTTFIEEIITFFLFFEFLALVTKYFKNNYHFPLRYFIYIGITAIIRLIIVSHDTSWDILFWSLSILALVISLVLVIRFASES